MRIYPTYTRAKKKRERATSSTPLLLRFWAEVQLEGHSGIPFEATQVVSAQLESWGYPRWREVWLSSKGGGDDDDDEVWASVDPLELLLALGWVIARSRALSVALTRHLQSARPVLEHVAPYPADLTTTPLALSAAVDARDAAEHFIAACKTCRTTSARSSPSTTQPKPRAATTTNANGNPALKDNAYLTEAWKRVRDLSFQTTMLQSKVQTSSSSVGALVAQQAKQTQLLAALALNASADSTWSSSRPSLYELRLATDATAGRAHVQALLTATEAIQMQVVALQAAESFFGWLTRLTVDKDESPRGHGEDDVVVVGDHDDDIIITNGRRSPADAIEALRKRCDALSARLVKEGSHIRAAGGTEGFSPPSPALTEDIWARAAGAAESAQCLAAAWEHRSNGGRDESGFDELPEDIASKLRERANHRAGDDDNDDDDGAIQVATRDRRVRRRRWVEPESQRRTQLSKARGVDLTMYGGPQLERKNPVGSKGKAVTAPSRHSSNSSTQRTAVEEITKVREELMASTRKLAAYRARFAETREAIARKLEGMGVRIFFAP